nr:hypothetical protein [Bacteroidota bacterium]
MKKFVIIILTIHCSLFTVHLLSQPCLPEGIQFSTQEEIDNFQTNYANCSEIEGYVEISGEEISNLDGLIVITSIGGHAIISGTSLPDLSGLNNLSHIGGFLMISYNNSLTSLTGLENLTSIEGTFDIGGNMGGGNSLLKNLNGLESLSYIGGSLKIYSNAQLASLAGLENLNTIMQGLVIGDDPNPWGNAGNPSLKDISALANVSTLTTDLRILYNDSLSSCEIQSICDYLVSPN